MQRTDEEFSVLLEGINAVEFGMVQNILEAEGIPAMRHGPDFDAGRLGQAAHDMLRGTDLLVPRASIERARALLDQVGWEHESAFDVPEARVGIPPAFLVLLLVVTVVTFLAALDQTRVLVPLFAAVGITALLYRAGVFDRR